MENNNTKKLELPISSKTGEPLKPFMKPGTSLLGIIFIALGFLGLWRDISYPSEAFPIYVDFIFSLIVGCVLILRAKLRNKHLLAHQVIVLISDLFLFIMGFVFLIIFWSIPGLLGMVGGIIIFLLSTLGSSIHCIYWLVKLEKYKVEN